MAIVDDDMKEDPVYYLFLDSLSSKRNETLRPENLAWADSCFNKDVDCSDADWTSVKYALLEILSSQAGRPSSAAAESSGRPTDDEILPCRVNAVSLEFDRGSDEDEDLIDDVAGEVECIEISEDDEEDLIIMGKKSERIKGKKRVDNPFCPNYSQDVVTVENQDSGLHLGSR